MTPLRRIEAIRDDLWVGDVNGQTWATNGLAALPCSEPHHGQKDESMMTKLAKLIAGASMDLPIAEPRELFSSGGGPMVFRALSHPKGSIFVDESLRRIFDGCVLHTEGPTKIIYAFRDGVLAGFFMPLKSPDGLDLQLIRDEAEWYAEQVLYRWPHDHL